MIRDACAKAAYYAAYGSAEDNKGWPEHRWEDLGFHGGQDVWYNVADAMNNVQISAFVSPEVAEAKLAEAIGADSLKPFWTLLNKENWRLIHG